MMKRTFLFSCMFAAGAIAGMGSAKALSLASSSLYGLSSLSSSMTQPVNVNAHGDEIILGAENFITSLTNEGIGFLSDDQITAEKQKEAFRSLLNKNFDMNTIARFSLGRYWRSASQAQRDEYLQLFKAMIVDVYSSRFEDYEGQKIQVTGSRQEGARDILVHSVIKQRSGPDVQVDWRVRNREGVYKVVDVIVEGVSMALTQRSDFSSVVQRGGGNMEALLMHLRQN